MENTKKPSDAELMNKYRWTVQLEEEISELEFKIKSKRELVKELAREVLYYTVKES